MAHDGEQIPGMLTLLRSASQNDPEETMTTETPMYPPALNTRRP